MTTAKHKAAWLKKNLKPGESYAGLILGQDGEADYHVVELSLHKDEKMSWHDAMAVANKAKAALPTRREASLLFANLKQHFQTDWYWTCEQSAGNDEYAWCQSFFNGGQYNGHKSDYNRVVLVRRIAIQ